jgi:AraC-like DNA-binding protein
MRQERIIVQRCFLPGIEATQAASGFAFGRHTHDQFGIGVLRQGAQRSASGRGPVEAVAGEVITVNPGEVHDGAPLGGPRAWRMLYFDPSRFLQAAGEAGTPDAAGVVFGRPVIQDAVLAARVLRAHALVTDGSADPLAQETALLDMLHVVLRHHTSRRSPPAGAAAITCARQRIEDDPAAHATLAELAAEVGLNRFQLLHGFRREIGLPPHAFRIVRRVQRARAMIRAGVPLAEAAAALGFADQSHINRAFLRVTGATPGAWAATRG